MLNEYEKKEYGALIVGFTMILFVIAITLIRNNPFTASESSADVKKILGTEKAKTDYKQTINAKDLQKKLLLSKDGTSLTLLDVRPFDEYINEHIVDAINITPAEFPVGSKIDSHNFVVIIGKDSNDENIKLALQGLEKENFGNVSVLLGGMQAWESVAGATVTYGNPTSFVDQSKVSYATQEDLKKALEQNVPMFIVDVRNADEYAKGHIPGAKNVPFEELEKKRTEITEKKVVVVGKNELQEFQASVQMYDMLLVSPFVLKGAMPKWIEQSFPIEK